MSLIHQDQMCVAATDVPTETQNCQIRNEAGLTSKIAQRGYPLLFGRFRTGLQIRISLDRLYDSGIMEHFGQNAHS